MVREKRHIRPEILKFGVALALSLGGIIYSVIRARRINKPSQSPPRPPPPGCGSLLDAGGENAVIRNDHPMLEAAPFCSNSASVASEKHEDWTNHKASPDSSISGLSPSSRCSGDKDGFLLPEFNELVRDFHLAASKAGFSPKKDAEIPLSDVEAPTSFKPYEREDYEQEIKNLNNMVRILRERERTLEIQLLEYCGLKEQETAVMELHNRLKINNVEAKLFSLKIESLQADNRRLEAQVADYAKVVGELEAARAKVKLLRKKLKSESEHNKEQIVALQQRVKVLMLEEHEAVAKDEDIRLRLHKLKDLEEEAEGLRKANHSLQLENSHLVRKLEYNKMFASSVLEDQEEESQRLRQLNEDLSKELEQLQADRCGDVEELVYLRWINACLRYELRNHEPGHGKAIARDLSKTLSPRSEEKAKQLIVEYANKEGFAEKGINITDSDFDQWSSSHSYVTDSGELDDTSFDNSSNHKTDTTTKTKFFSKFRRLLRGKDSHHHSRSSSMEIIASVDDASLGIDGLSKHLKSSSLGSSRSSVDFDRLKMLKVDDVKYTGSSSRNSDVGPPLVYKSIALGRESGNGDFPKESIIHENTGTGQKSELGKYAKVLKDSSVERTKSSRIRRSASHASF
ncbi:hypothetical protein C3L33_00215, partial [Rhododendron williamsianum]